MTDLFVDEKPHREVVEEFASMVDAIEEGRWGDEKRHRMNVHRLGFTVVRRPPPAAKSPRRTGPSPRPASPAPQGVLSGGLSRGLIPNAETKKKPPVVAGGLLDSACVVGSVSSTSDLSSQPSAEARTLVP